VAYRDGLTSLSDDALDNEMKSLKDTYEKKIQLMTDEINSLKETHEQKNKLIMEAKANLSCSSKGQTTKTQRRGDISKKEAF
jgi:hypothetical protein